MTQKSIGTARLGDKINTINYLSFLEKIFSKKKKKQS
jgi:hypothetical protein